MLLKLSHKEPKLPTISELKIYIYSQDISTTDNLQQMGTWQYIQNGL